MSADDNVLPGGDATAPETVDRCGCGRIGAAVCWLGENSTARWLFGCRRIRRSGPGA